MPAPRAVVPVSPNDFGSITGAEYLSIEELRELSVSLASGKAVRLPGESTAIDIVDRLEADRRTITAVYRRTRDEIGADGTLTPAAEWLLDNIHLIEENLRQVARDLPRRFYRRLPTGVVSNDGALPRVLALAWLCIAHSNGEFTEARLTAMVESHQSRAALTIGELWALPSMLRFVLLVHLARLAALIEQRRLERRAGNELADRLLGNEDAASVSARLAASASLAASDAFVSQLLYRVRDGVTTMRGVIDWLDIQLRKRGLDAGEVLIAEQTRLSAGNVTIGNIVNSLRAIDDIDWRTWFSTVSTVDALLGAESDFDALDFTSRDRYRNAIERLSRRSGVDELDVAHRALEQALKTSHAEGDQRSASSNVGAWLVGDRRVDLERELGADATLRERIGRRWLSLGWLAIAVPIMGATLAFMLVAAVLLSMSSAGFGTIVLLSLCAALPASEAASGLFNTLASMAASPTRLTGYDFEEGVPADWRTLVVVPCLLDSRDGVDDLVRALEVHYLSTTRGEVYFALLSDWTDAAHERDAHDDELLLHARHRIDALDTRYRAGGPRRFFLLHRRRQHDAIDGIWRGWERKRGKLLELDQLLRGESGTSFLSGARSGDDEGAEEREELPRDVRFVMTLDSDTRLTRDAVTRLVGKLAHPLNRPVVDPLTRRVVRGHAILQPRVTPSLTSGSEASLFQRIFSVNRGLDPYVFSVSDVYQDLLDEGSFTGKGLYDVEAFGAVFDARFPEGAILSHDLLEGSIARSALVTDVELVEDFPTRYASELSRQHRWARGDWQLLPWIAGRDAGVSMLGRWKMVDNLRRSLVPIAWVLASLVGWCTLETRPAVLWQLALILSLFVAPTLSLLRAFAPLGTESLRRSRWRMRLGDTLDATAQVALRIVFIAHAAALMGDAIVRTVYRLTVSRRRLLEWRTTAAMQSGDTPGVGSHLHAMAGSMVIGIAGLVLVALVQPENLLLAWLLSFAWIAAPPVAWFVSQSAETEDRLTVAPDDERALRRIARRTWVYFDTFVTAEHHHLPPDNLQEDPVPVVAPRTSPTNIGVYLLSIVSARDFGWIGFGDALDRLEATLDSVERLETYRGHLLNWYDTRRAVPLEPRYVSAVDSGNLAGHLVTLSSVCRHWAEAPYVHLHVGTGGLYDTAGVLLEELAAVPDDRRALRPLRTRLKERLDSFSNVVVKRDERGLTNVRLVDLEPLSKDIRTLALELDNEIDSQETHVMRDWAVRLDDTCRALLDDLSLAKRPVNELRDRLSSTGERARRLAFQMDFAFLMNPTRRLLAIGCRVDSVPIDGGLDGACYDLLASEARLTSLFAIAKGDLPTEHWFRLGRPTTPVGSRGALVSWSGSMFEYLMPPLVMKEQVGGILNQTNRLVCRRQIEYGNARGLPWGISEAALNARDGELTYQYSNFGVPSLALKRGLGHDAVVAPYASLLASQYVPREAVRNLERLRKLGALGRYGFHDAVDFTPSRLPEGRSHVVVRNYMAHHHGMSILAVSNVVFEGRLRTRFHEDPVIEAAELLLQEKAPRTVPQPNAHLAAEALGGSAELPAAVVRVIDDPVVAERAVALLSNGHYSLLLSATGAGRAMWNGLAVTRWQPDTVEDLEGSFLFITDLDDGEWWSATAAPRAAPNERTRTVFSDSKAEFHKSVGTLRSEVEVNIASESDGECRRVTLENTGDRDRYVEITSYAEPVLALAANDLAHPLFSKMFLVTDIVREHDAIHVWRKPRTHGEPDMHVAHLVVADEGDRQSTAYETDRRAFIGRGRTLATAAAFDPGATLGEHDGFTLDPVMVLRRRLRVPPGKRVGLTFWTIVAPTRADVESAIVRYRHPESAAREAMHAWTRSQVQLRHLGVSSDEAVVFQRLATWLAYPLPLLDPGLDAGQPLSQSALWPLGVSGDLPIVLLRIDNEADLPVVRKAIRAQEYLRARGLGFDLAILNEQASSYVQDLQRAIEAARDNATVTAHAADGAEHLFALRLDLIDVRAHAALTAIARIVMHARNGRFSTHLDRLAAARANEPGLRADNPYRPLLPERERPMAAVPIDGSDLLFWNGTGGFDPDSGDYEIRLPTGGATPQPWINVIANPRFGFHVSAEGGGYTWSLNSRDHALTPWSNDPVIDRPGETLHVVDLESGLCTSPFVAQSDPSLAGARYRVRHSPGISRFEAQALDGMSLGLSQFVAGEDPVKRSELTMSSNDDRARHLRIYVAAEWVLGSDATKSAAAIRVIHDTASDALFATNPYSVEHDERVAFLCVDNALSSWTTSRREFVGAGSAMRPEGALRRRRLESASIPAGDPASVLSIDLVLPAGAEVRLGILLGDAASEHQARELVERHRHTPATRTITSIEGGWQRTLDIVQVETPDRAFDLMVNRWLPYQALACRLTARSAFYQASGAFGFRDQLQDSLAFLWHDSGIARARILAAAGRQFPQGDVQHWWLPGTGAGVRTMIADDVVWLAHATAHYIEVTADEKILDEVVDFIDGPALEPGKHDAYFVPEAAGESATLVEHIGRALDLAIERTGEHGLPLFLGGDWNDGMNRVGEAGRGESVWLGWFLLGALGPAADLVESRGQLQRATAWRAHAVLLNRALNSAGWDGDWYRRGYYDDGMPLGSAESEECRIDSIAQSWSVLSQEGDPVRSAQALDAVLERLVDREENLVRLFTPPFADTAQQPGYIKGYPPGVRENGGQYTHAATWLVAALAQSGRLDAALEVFTMLNPVSHALDAQAAERYRVEPYVVAADVYGAGDRTGRGGWTWYTGSAGWLHRVALEGILGITRQGDRLFVRGDLPSGWDGWTVRLKVSDRVRIVRASRNEEDACVIELDGQRVTNPSEGVLLSG